MPFTPFHLGPGAAFKLVGAGGFSFALFGYAQVLMDLEPLVRLYRGDAVLHGLSHTLVGALGIGVFAAATGRGVYRVGARVWNGRLTHRRFQLPDEVSWRVAVVTAFIGTFSHVLLDGFLYPDMAPFAPVSAANPALGHLSLEAVHTLCVGAGAVGVLGLIGGWLWEELMELLED